MDFVARVFPRLWSLVLLCGLPLSATAARAQDVFEAPPRLLAVGDVHGDLEAFGAILKAAGLVDEKLRWTGGRAHLVQLGDRVDRGPQSRKVMDLLMRLDKEARKSGGRVHALTGNHEAMNVLGDLRYVTPEEFAEFRGPDSARYREALWEKTLEERKAKGQTSGPEDRKAFDAERPLGFVEHRQGWGPKGTYGRWVAQCPAVLKVGDTLFVHGGIAPKYADFSLADLNDKVRRELADPSPLTALVSQDTEGPLWYRGLAQGGPEALAHVEALLVRHQVKRIVIGHTPAEGLVWPRYSGRVVVVDVGLSKAYGGPPAALLIEDGRLVALHRGRHLALPEGEGEPLVRYVREAAALEPAGSRVFGLLERLQSEAVPASAPPR